ncbi:MAG: efflux RND transporter permease subunit [Spirochaetes bacterium]|nr:efflux RND transporter permease subunit [Spirochaetota bacterium]
MKKLIEYFARHKLVVSILTVFIFIVGLISLLGIKQEVFPDVSMDAINVTAVYPGASAKDVEINVVIPIERKLQAISGIDNFTSISMENQGRVFIEIDEDVENKQSVKDEIFRELSNVAGLPDEVDDLNIHEMNSKLKEVYEIGVYIDPPPIKNQDFVKMLNQIPSKSDQKMVENAFELDQKKHELYIKKGISSADQIKIAELINQTGYKYKLVSHTELYQFIDQLEKQLLNVGGVSDIRLNGYRDREIKINVIPEKMDQYYISFNDIVNSIKKRNVRVPGGTMESDNGEYSIVTVGEFIDPMEIKDVIIRSNYEQQRITIDDIAEIEDGFEKENIQIRINNNSGVTLEVIKKGEADIIVTTDNIKAFLNKANIPEGISITKIMDDSLSIKTLLRIVMNNAIIGFLMVFVLILIFLKDPKTSLWTAFGIPISLLITFTCMRLMDISMNMISLGALAMLLGIIVDDSIVVSESIYKYRAKGFKPIEAAYLGVKDVAAPVLVSILTTIVAFIPLYLIKGMMGKFIVIFPTIVIIALLASLFESLFFLPAHLIHSNKKKKGKDGKEKKLEPKWFKVVEKGYKKFLTIVLKFRYLVLALFIGFFIFTISLSSETIRNFVLIEDDSSDAISLKLEALEGSNLDKTSEYISLVESVLQEEIKPEELLSIKSTIGHHNDNPRVEEGKHTNWAIIRVNLVPRANRQRDTFEITRELRKKINSDKIPVFTKIEIEEVYMAPDPGKPVNVKLIGNNDKKVKTLGYKIKDYLYTIDGITNIEDSSETVRKEWKIHFDYYKMAQLGIDVDTVAQTVRTAFEGTKATSLQYTDKDLDFRVQLVSKNGTAKEKNQDYLLNLLVPNKTGRLLKLKDVASLSLVESEFSIEHEDGDRTFTITADLNTNDLTSMQILQMVQKEFGEEIDQHSDIFLDFGGEAMESQESLRDLGLAFLVAILLIYFILILLFNDLSQPFLIMLAIPFGIVGALLAFVAHSMPLSFMGIIGIIGLCGVVVNDCVVMVSFINKQMKNTDLSTFKTAIVDGAKERLRPVILTTITTVAGLLPTAYGIGGKSPMITPIAIAIAYGLLFATLLTLIFIPSIYCIRLDIIHVFDRIFKKHKKDPLEEAAQE